MLYDDTMMSRFGTVDVALELVYSPAGWRQIMAILSHMVVTGTEKDSFLGVIRYRGYSPMFDVEDGVSPIPPAYEANVVMNDAGYVVSVLFIRLPTRAVPAAEVA